MIYKNQVEKVLFKNYIFSFDKILLINQTSIFNADAESLVRKDSITKSQKTDYFY